MYQLVLRGQCCQVCRATIVTPNLPEAELLLGRSLAAQEDLSAVADRLSQQFGVTILLKGGHRAGSVAADFLADGSTVYRLESSFVNAATTHGTGCTLSAAIAANLALGKDMIDAVATAKAFVYGSLLTCGKIGDRVSSLGIPDNIDPAKIKVTQLI